VTGVQTCALPILQSPQLFETPVLAQPDASTVHSVTQTQLPKDILSPMSQNIVANLIAAAVAPDAPTTATIVSKPASVQIHKVETPPVLLLEPDTQAIAHVSLTPTIQESATSKAALVAGFIKDKPVITLFTPDGKPAQHLLLQTAPENIPAGTQLQITPPVISEQTALQTPAPLAAPFPLSFLTPDDWPTLNQVAQTLAQTNPQAMQSLASTAPTPAMPARFGAAALLFLAVVRSGDLSGWLGEKGTESLRRAGANSLLSRLSQEGNALNRLSAEPVSGEWRAVSLPMFWQGEFQKMALYYRHEQEDSKQDDDKNPFTRFIFDLSLSRMGKVQLDGLHRPQKLDLVVRTERPFSSTMQMNMRRTYTNALEQTSLSGELSFQNRPEQWMHITLKNKDLFAQEI
jgi:hypothetical protein